MLIKARYVAGSSSLAADFIDMIQPFRYPRSISEQVPGEVAEMKDIGLPFGAKKVFHYDDQKDVGVMTEHSYRRAWDDFTKYVSLMLTVFKNHEDVMKEWADAKEELTSLAYWENYLEL